jgi:hypothetical protein
VGVGWGGASKQEGGRGEKGGRGIRLILTRVFEGIRGLSAEQGFISGQKNLEAAPGTGMGRDQGGGMGAGATRQACINPAEVDAPTAAPTTCPRQFRTQPVVAPPRRHPRGRAARKIWR